MAAAATILPFLVITVLFATRSTWCQRPSYAGSTGGKWENYVGQIIPPGTPWPAKAEDYSTTPKSGTKTASSAGPIKVTDLFGTDTPRPEKEDQTASLPLNNDFDSTGTTIQEMVTQSYTTLRYQTTGGETYASQLNKVEEDKVKLNTNANGIKPSIVLEYKPNRPSFAGATGGSGITGIANSSSPTTASPSIVLEYKPNRPSFAGSTGGTWESLVGQRVPESTTTEKETKVVSNSNSSTTASPSIVLEYKPNRPSFAGATGGTWESLVGQRVPESTTTQKETNVVSHSIFSTIPKTQANASLISTATSNHSIIFQPNSRNSERDINKNGTIKATEIFLEAEKWKDNSTNKENDSKMHPTLNPILNIEEDPHKNKRLLIN